ncbi:MAG: metallophosphoesterase [Desulfurococcales archaeon]|nr:metallophosphoesterase [Desulfurococcales archaeon]
MIRTVRHRYLKLIAIVIAVLLVAVLLDSLVLEPQAIILSVTNLSIRDSRVPSGKVIKLIHLTDLHISTYGFRESRITELVRSLKPDAVIMTGDYISSPEGLDPLHMFINELRASVGNAPIVAILGNWDFWSGVPGEVVKLLREYGIQVLNNTYVILHVRNCRITFAGFSSFTGTYEISNFSILNEVPNEYPLIVLLHEPSLIRHVLRHGSNVTLVLAGHCHGGQVKLISAPLFLPEGCEVCYEGACRLDGVFMYVSRGVGTSLFPIRFFSPPEVAVIYLSSSS